MQKIYPHLWFDKEVNEAVALYTSIFPNSKIISKRTITGTPSGDCDILTFTLAGQQFMAINGGPYFKFTPAISLVVNCDTQEELDAYWSKLSAVPEAEQCGWLQDKYGVSWQIIPSRMNEMMEKGTKEQIDRVTKAFLQMKKFDINKLEEAYRG